MNKLKKCYLTIYRKNEDRRKIWWKEFADEELAYNFALLCRTILDVFNIKIVDKIDTSIPNNIFIELECDYEKNIVNAISQYVEHLKRNIL